MRRYIENSIHIKKCKDLTGMQFGRLVALKMERESPKSDYWLCRCACGNEKVIRCDSLLSGKTKSCGCLLRESASHRAKKHGMCKSKIYAVFYGMHSRCENTKDVAYKYYGGRGIDVCKEWSGEHGFETFYSWALKNGYHEGLTLDRINTNGIYEPSNCKWSTRLEQQQNIRSNVIVICDCNKMTLRQAEELYGTPPNTIYERLKRGWSDEDAVKTQVQSKFINKKYL